MTLRQYYTNIQLSDQKSKFIFTIMERCRVNYPTVRSWIARDDAPYRRRPKPIYRQILAEITGLNEDDFI